MSEICENCNTELNSMNAHIEGTIGNDWELFCDTCGEEFIFN